MQAQEKRPQKDYAERAAATESVRAGASPSAQKATARRAWGAAGGVSKGAALFGRGAVGGEAATAL